ncbi:mitochondrial uncoupling protein 5-like [Senna tora]|uniref:Mitochondrial uncoupling protein 5-like n=1 Tax=Senna tora TaxID=362788 RepID=A0A834T760_9FABA|nr:mitochondrial uncoupling protein 5-like [Senna tora]
MSVKGFVEGGIASIVAGCTTHPLDLIKVRMQLQGENHSCSINMRPAFAFHSQFSTTTAPPTTILGLQRRAGPISVGVRIVQSEGVAALFSGVSATVLRQTLYSTTRMGLYDVLKHKWADPDAGNMPLIRKIAAGLIAGGIGATIGNPADVAMVRMQADGRLPAAQRRGYKGVFDAIMRMSSEEGIASLWRAVASNPVDVIKTRVMNMKVEAGATPPYNGALDCALKTVRAEGPMALYKGFVPTISRQGPFTVVLFVTLEQVRKLLKDF